MDRPPLAQVCISKDATVREAITCIDRSGAISIALLIDRDGKLISVLTDGDVRRGILHRLSLDASVMELLPIKEKMPNSKAVTALVGTGRPILLQIMQQKGVRQLPIVDAQGKVIDIVLLRDLLPEVASDLEAVIMAGGFGKRLWPLTEDVPKPMLPLGGRPLLERIVSQLQTAGIHRLNITTHYKSEKIVAHFGTGSAFGVDIRYVNEERPLGTGGSLRLMQHKTPILVINGDVLTGIDFRQLHDYHKEQCADITVAVSQHSLQVPYGVVESDGANVTALKEKPEITVFINAGIYLLEPSVYDYIPDDQHFNMTELVERLIKARRNVVCFPIREYWIDIGQHNDYARAELDVTSGGVSQ